MSAKELVIRPITAKEANSVVRRVHYSGKIVQNSSLHIGAFWRGNLEGAMQFGPPMVKAMVLPLVRGTGWNQMLELNRMAFGEALPRNAESRALGVAFRLIRKHRPDIKWCLSFSDATQCGDGTIYRASGFLLTGIKRNTGMWRLPDGEVVTDMSMRPTNPSPINRKWRRIAGMPSAASGRVLTAVGAERLPGYQLRYIRFLDRSWVDRLTVPVIPFSDIPEDARMYRGEKRAGP